VIGAQIPGEPCVPGASGKCRVASQFAHTGHGARVALLVLLAEPHEVVEVGRPCRSEVDFSVHITRAQQVLEQLPVWVRRDALPPGVEAEILFSLDRYAKAASEAWA